MDAGELVVSVESGRVRGGRSRGIRYWRGIPYAAAPIGAYRFRAPRPPEPWEGVRDARRFGPVAPQLHRGQFHGAPRRVPRSEDCLRLDVTEPETRSTSSPLPVLVWVHGGGFSVGSTREYGGVGRALAASGDVVVVSVGYRLGALGWLDLRAYSTPERPIEANLGLQDLVAALRWVRTNIAAFGGDPDRVTLIGESAGAAAVTALLTMPSAHGLVAGAIAQSAPPNAVYPPDVTAAWAHEFVGLLGEVADADVESESTGEAADLLHDSDAMLLARATLALTLRAPDAYPGATCLAPVIDGEVLPERPLDAYRDGRAARVPLIIGTNDREGALFEGRIDILPTTKRRIRAVFAATRKRSRRAIKAQYPGLPERRPAADFAGDFTFWYPSVKLAERHSRFAPVYMYRFDAAPRIVKMLGLDATHGLELFPLFGLLGSRRGLAMTALGGRRMLERLGRRMRLHWNTFAAHGEPSDGWPAYDEASRATLVFDSVDRVELDPRSERRRAWQEFVPHV